MTYTKQTQCCILYVCLSSFFSNLTSLLLMYYGFWFCIFMGCMWVCVSVSVCVSCAGGGVSFLFLFVCFVLFWLVCFIYFILFFLDVCFLMREQERVRVWLVRKGKVSRRSWESVTETYCMKKKSTSKNRKEIFLDGTPCNHLVTPCQHWGSPNHLVTLAYSGAVLIWTLTGSLGSGPHALAFSTHTLYRRLLWAYSLTW